MDKVKEYLESSTIHGLSYISTSKSRIAKAGWLIIVVLGFGSAGYLILSSFSDWASSPVSTTITPHPVSDLPFPDVTICPPKGLNSALKYDLLMLANMTISQVKKEHLLNSAKIIFEKSGGEANAKNIESLSNNANLAKSLEAFKTFQRSEMKVT